jgi:uncharacterized protein (DUF427 family)
MPRALVNGTVVAESDNYEVVEGNIYFPPESIKKEFFKDSSMRSSCPWKGVANYYSLSVDGEDIPDVAWYYPEPSQAASNIKDYVAFYPAVKIEK